MLATVRPDLLIEFHSAELRDWCQQTLLANTYSVFTVRHPHYARDSDLYHQHGWLRAFPA